MLFFDKWMGAKRVIYGRRRQLTPENMIVPHRDLEEEGMKMSFRRFVVAGAALLPMSCAGMAIGGADGVTYDPTTCQMLEDQREQLIDAKLEVLQDPASFFDKHPDADGYPISFVVSQISQMIRETDQLKTSMDCSTDERGDD